DTLVATEPSELVVTKVVVYSWNAPKIDVDVVKEPAESVVTSTTPESVATEPSELVVTKVVVYSCNPSLDASLEASLDGNNDVVVYNRPAELVVTSTTPESVATEPSELVATKVVVYSWNAPKIDVDVVKEPAESVVTTITSKSVDTEPSELVTVATVV
ncbi:hypothetical protein OXX79_014216, partial [Metschnikowia pulcherrima]